MAFFILCHLHYMTTSTHCCSISEAGLFFVMTMRLMTGNTGNTKAGTVQIRFITLTGMTIISGVALQALFSQWATFTLLTLVAFQ